MQFLGPQRMRNQSKYERAYRERRRRTMAPAAGGQLAEVAPPAKVLAETPAHSTTGPAGATSDGEKAARKRSRRSGVEQPSASTLDGAPATPPAPTADLSEEELERLTAPGLPPEA